MESKDIMLKAKKLYTYKAQCYCNLCGIRMRDVKLVTNYPLSDDQPEVYSIKVCKICATGKLD